MSQINRKKSNVILYIQEPCIHDNFNEWKVKWYLCHPELQNGKGAWGFTLHPSGSGQNGLTKTQMDGCHYPAAIL